MKEISKEHLYFVYKELKEQIDGEYYEYFVGIDDDGDEIFIKNYELCSFINKCINEGIKYEEYELCDKFKKLLKCDDIFEK